jgi:hypothetical protein
MMASGLASRPFRRRSSATGPSIRRVARQVVAAEALQREDRPRAQRRHRPFDRRPASRPTIGVHDHELRPAVVARRRSA